LLSLIGVLCPQGAKAHPPVETKGHRLNKRDWKTTLRLRQPYRANSKGAALQRAESGVPVIADRSMAHYTPASVTQRISAQLTGQVWLFSEDCCAKNTQGPRLRPRSGHQASRILHFDTSNQCVMWPPAIVSSADSPISIYSCRRSLMIRHFHPDGLAS
jgi:hypothetical protein